MPWWDVPKDLSYPANNLVIEYGNTKDIVVINSSHPGFERSAVNAARKFKFKPRVIDGEAVSVFDVYKLIEFKLADQ